MKKNESLMKQAPGWVSLLVIFSLFIYSVSLRSGVPDMAEESKEIAKTATYIDSANSLKTMISSMDRHVQYAVREWEFAFNVAVFGLFLASVAATVFLFLYISTQRKVDKLTAALGEKNKKE